LVKFLLFSTLPVRILEFQFYGYHTWMVRTYLYRILMVHILVFQFLLAVVVVVEVEIKVFVIT
jgi:hypothetical protein